MLLSNAIPLYGVVSHQFGGLEVIILYLIETIIIGAFHAVRMLGYGASFGFKNSKSLPLTLFFTGFFLFHYFMFVFVQSAIFFGFMSTKFPEFGSGFDVIHNFSLFFKSPYLLAIYGFLFSQIAYTGQELMVSTPFNNLTQGEYMFLPYTRIFIQQFVVIFGAMIFLIFNSVTALVVLFILLKTTGEYLGQRYGEKWLKPVIKNND